MKTIIIGTMSNPPEPSERLTTSRVAEILGWSRWTVWRESFANLPYTTTRGGHRRYRTEDVEALAARHAESPAPSVVEGDGA